MSSQSYTILVWRFTFAFLLLFTPLQCLKPTRLKDVQVHVGDLVSAAFGHLRNLKEKNTMQFPHPFFLGSSQVDV